MEKMKQCKECICESCKQVADLEQENEELKAENERLKREYDILDGIIDVNNAKIGQLEKENKELKFYIDSYAQVWEVDKYKQCLQEIKEIAKILFAKISLFEMKDIARYIQQILQKISEVE